MPIGIIDRIEDDRHIIIIFYSEDRQVVCEHGDLPEEACHSGAVIEADIDEDDISNVNYLPDEEKSKRERMRRKRDELMEE